jgi:cell division septation protein DedD
LREQNFRVRQSTSRAAGAATSTPAPAAAEAPKSSADRYEVIVSGASPADVNAKLGAKGLAFQSGPDGAVITPSLPLGEAVALSKDLSGENLAVKVRRVVPARAAATVAIVEGGETLHRVRVGSFPDRASAQAALRDLEAKGYKPFLARGSE